MFYGNYPLSFDSKQRSQFPVKCRTIILALDTPGLKATLSREGCLLVMPDAVWLEKYEELLSMNFEADDYLRIFEGHTEDIAFDTIGRVHFSAGLRSAAKIEDNAVMLGRGDHFEVWEPSAYETRMAMTRSRAVPAQITQTPMNSKLTRIAKLQAQVLRNKVPELAGSAVDNNNLED